MKKTLPVSQLTFFERYGRMILGLFFVATPFLAYFATRAVQNNRNDVTDWLPSSYSETADLQWFRKHFVGDQFILISWEGCRLGDNPHHEKAKRDDPRINQLANLLVSEEEFSQGDDLEITTDTTAPLTYRHYFKSVTTARQLLDRLTNPPTGMPYAVAVARLQGSLIGPDGHQTAVVATLSDQAIGKFRDVLGYSSVGLLGKRRPQGAIFKAFRACDIDVDSVHLGGPPVDNVAIDEEGERTLVRLAGYSGLLGITLAWWALRSLKLTAIVFACGILSAAASLSVIWLSGEETDAISMSMPPLVYVLAISGAVHIINYWRDEATKYGAQSASGRAVAHAWRPALLCSVTTACGLLSLYTSELTPIRKFGIFSAIGVILMLAVQFLFLPAALHWLATPPKGVPRSARKSGNGKRNMTFQKQPEKLWHKFGGWIIGHHRLVVWVSTVLVVLAGIGITKLRTNIDLMKLFSPQARILHDYHWLESNVGRMMPMEIVLKFSDDLRKLNLDTPSDDSRLSLLERAAIVAEVQRTLRMRFGPPGEDIIGNSMSAVTFIPSWSVHQGSLRAVTQRSVLNGQLEDNYDALVNSGYLSQDQENDAELWRISVRVAAFKDVDYGRFTGEIRNLVDPIIARHNQAIDARFSASVPLGSSSDQDLKLSAVYTGVIPIVYKAQRALLDSLIQSTVWSILTITPLLMFVTRGLVAGLVAMLPNLLPLLVVFGGMGWLHLPIDIGSMMSASIALGVAVDDTIHYLSWYRQELNVSEDRNVAIVATYERCATPTLQAALISGLGLSVFAFSTFVPTKQFGYLMLVILIAGVVAELVLLPALLAGPLGSVFRRQKTIAPSSDIAQT